MDRRSHILRDSPPDLLNKIARMGETFQCSTLTLFVCDADSTDAGLSSTRDPHWIKPCRLTLRASSTNTTFEPIHTSPSIAVKYYQLRFLTELGISRRVLACGAFYFGQRQMSRICRCKSSQESYSTHTGRVESPITLHDFRKIGSNNRFGSKSHMAAMVAKEIIHSTSGTS